MDDQLDAALAAIREAIEPDAVVGVYLYGSAVAGGLRPDSDIDLFVVAGRQLSAVERRRLPDRLRPISRRSLRPHPWRPLEVSVVARSDVRPWRYPARMDMLYGEWMDDEEITAVVTGGSWPNPDLAVLAEMVRTRSRALVGPPADEVLDPVPRADLVRAILDSMPALLTDLTSDTRNVLLTLARMWWTIETGEIRSKDEAVALVLERLPPPVRPVLAEARRLYLDGGYGTWDEATVRAAVDALVERIRAAAASGSR